MVSWIWGNAGISVGIGIGSFVTWRIGGSFRSSSTGLAGLVDEIGDPWPISRRGRPAVHSPRKITGICVLTVMLGLSYRKMETLLHILKLPWNEPVPDHGTIHDAFKRMPEEYPTTILQKSALHSRVRLV